MPSRAQSANNSPRARGRSDPELRGDGRTDGDARPAHLGMLVAPAAQQFPRARPCSTRTAPDRARRRPPSPTRARPRLRLRQGGGARRAPPRARRRRSSRAPAPTFGGRSRGAGAAASTAVAYTTMSMRRARHRLLDERDAVAGSRTSTVMAVAAPASSIASSSCFGAAGGEHHRRAGAYGCLADRAADPADAPLRGCVGRRRRPAHLHRSLAARRPSSPRSLIRPWPSRRARRGRRRAGDSSYRPLLIA